MPISAQEVLHIARLARLALTDDEVAAFTEQLGNIFEYMKKLNELDTQDIDETAHAITLRNVLREDRVESFADRERIFSNAPDREGDCFRVPKIIED